MPHRPIDDICTERVLDFLRAKNYFNEMDFIISLDQRLFEFLNSTLTHPWLDSFFPFITDLHKSIYFQITVYPLIFFIFLKRYGTKAIKLFLILAICLGFTDFSGSQVIKKNIQRLRPGDNPQVQSIIKSTYGGTSFISNHSANMFAFAAFTGFFLPTLRIAFFLLAFLIAYSRVYVGVHFPLDVISGALYGLVMGKLFAYLCVRLLKIIPAQTKKIDKQGLTT